jgi:hypothetical protein
MVFSKSFKFVKISVNSRMIFDFEKAIRGGRMAA